MTSGERPLKPTVAVWNKAYLINSISERSVCILVVLLQALANWFKTCLERSGLFLGFVTSESCETWREAVQPFWAVNPCWRTSCYRNMLLVCAPVDQGVGTARCRWASRSQRRGRFWSSPAFWMRAWMSPSWSSVCFKIDDALRSYFFRYCVASTI